MSSSHEGNTVKQWLFSFDVEPSPAALPVVVVHLDERMRCQHVIGHQRGGTVRIGGCGSRTVVDGDRVHRASISSVRGCDSDKSQHTRRCACPASFGIGAGQLLQVLQTEGT